MAEWQVIVVGMKTGAYPITVAVNFEEFRKTTVSRFRKLIHQKWPDVDSDFENMRLIFAGKQLDDRKNGKSMTMEDYSIERNSTIQVVFRVHGGMDSSTVIVERVPRPQVTEKKHDLSSRSLEFTTKQPDVIMGSDPDDQPRIIMSCGHAFDANSLTRWCHQILDEGKCEFYCPAIVSGTRQCKKVWSYSEVRKVAHLNEEEKKYFEAKVSQFAAQKCWDIKECPSCHSFVERTDFSNLRVHCSVCEDFDFCWQCLSKWSGPTTSSVQCGNPNCKNRDILALRDAPLVTLKELPADIQVPNLRACPICGKIVEHNTEGCKCIVCPRCSEEFCFLCLELKAKCLGSAPWSYYSSCKKPVAPRQTKIPVWSQTPSSVPTTTPTPDVPATTDSKRMCIIL